MHLFSILKVHSFFFLLALIHSALSDSWLPCRRETHMYTTNARYFASNETSVVHNPTIIIIPDLQKGNKEVESEKKRSGGNRERKMRNIQSWRFMCVLPLLYANTIANDVHFSKKERKKIIQRMEIKTSQFSSSLSHCYVVHSYCKFLIYGLILCSIMKFINFLRNDFFLLTIFFSPTLFLLPCDK